MNELNLMTWFTDRKVAFLPKHFVPTKSKVTDDSINWVLEKLSGRFYIKTSNQFWEDTREIYFEDPKEAMVYELTWS
jgi:hypothetical protein